MKKVSMQDVATIANVSKVKVSKYIKDGTGNEDEIKLIQEAIKSSGYVMAKKVDKTITESKFNFLLLCETTLVPRTRNMIEALQNVCRSKEGLLTCIFTNNNRNIIFNALNSVDKMHFDGVLIENNPYVNEIEDYLKQNKIPHLFVNSWCDKIQSINFDEEMAGQVLGNYALGKQNLILRYLGYQDSLSQLREDGIKKAYLNRNQPFDYASYGCNLTYTDMFDKIKEILSEHIDLLILGYDEMAIPLFKYIQEYHVHIPENLSLISFGGHAYTQVTSPTLTCVQYNYDTFAKDIYKNMCLVINNKEIEATTASFELLEGESTRK